MNSKAYPLVSVRIPLYNHENYIKQCLDSIVDDPYPNKEIVIIDDGSTDRSRYVVEEWIRDNIHKIRIHFISRENRGITSTLNELNSLCSGEFIAGVASDDYLLKGAIGERVEYMRQTLSDAIFADCIVVDESGAVIFNSALTDIYRVDIDKYFNFESLRREIVNNWSVPGSTLMVRRSIYNEYRYDENSIVEDYDFFLFLVAKNKLSFFNKKVSAYRIHKTNSHKHHSYFKRQMSILKALIRNIRYFSWDMRQDIIKRIFWILKKTIKHTIIQRKR